MSKKIGGLVALAAMCALSLFLVNCGSSSSRPSGTVYVLTEGSNGVGNNVSSFAADLSSGALSLINSNASTCGSTNGCGLPLDIVLDPTGANAFVLNQGVPGGGVPPSIYPFSVNSDGSLSAPGSAVTWACSGVTVSGCSDAAVAMVEDPSGQFLYVIDQGSSPPPGYPPPSSDPSCPHEPTGPTDVCPSISVFAMQPGSSSLTLESGSPFYLSKLPTALSAITFTPSGSSTAQTLLFVTSNLDICSANCKLPFHSDNTVSVFNVSTSGVLSEQQNSPYAISVNNPISVLAVNTNPAGQNTGGLFVYVGNSDQNGGALNPFQVCTVVGSAGCTTQDVQNNLLKPLVEVCSQPPCNNIPPSAAGQMPVQMVVDPTNNFLYSLSQGTNAVFAFRINTTAGTLTPLNPASEPTGAKPVSMALHPSVNNTGQFLYTSNNGSSNISGFGVSTTTGQLFSPTTVTAPAAPTGIAVH